MESMAEKTRVAVEVMIEKSICNSIRDYEYLRNKAKPFSDEWHRADGALFALDDLGVKLFGCHLNKLEHEKLGGGR